MRRKAIIATISIIILLMAAGCKTVKYIPVETVRTETKHTTDTIEKVDTFIKEAITKIAEVDSAYMAGYGIGLKEGQRAWLVEKEQKQQAVSTVSTAKTAATVKSENKPQIVEVEKPLSWFERVKQNTWTWLLIASIAEALAMIGIICVKGGNR